MIQPARTIAVTARRRAWLSRCARELLTRTATKHDLKIVLTEYRHALHALLTTTSP